MAKVYVVTSGEYSDYRIAAIFSTRELAEAYVAKARSEAYTECNDAEEWTLDERAGWEIGPVWSSVIDLKTGEIVHSREKATVLRDPGATEKWTHALNAVVNSPVSQEHADKVAVEMRQEWLRTRPQPPPAVG